tara:strand:+ start:1575 stop:1940 length:366 start_codon:yes stop_codon:yes gene_type:complete
MFDMTTIILSLISLLSIVANIIFILYIRRVILRVYNASEEASVIFTRLDTFREHLTGVYEMPTFYGDETLSALLTHAKELSEFLVQYENIYSFTQPDLLEQLEAATLEAKEEDETKEKEEK